MISVVEIMFSNLFLAIVTGILSSLDPESWSCWFSSGVAVVSSFTPVSTLPGPKFPAVDLKNIRTENKQILFWFVAEFAKIILCFFIAEFYCFLLLMCAWRKDILFTKSASSHDKRSTLGAPDFVWFKHLFSLTYLSLKIFHSCATASSMHT